MEEAFETVPVGNPGNAADARVMRDGTSGYGSVGYTYNIGKYEVTAGQYTEFLNAVAATDPHGLYHTGMWSTGAGCKIQRSGVSGSLTYSVASEYANRPVNHVSWGDAARFANWLHNGQPTGAQNASTTEDGAYTLNGAMDNNQLLAVVRNSNAKWAIPTEDEWYKAAYHKNDGVTGNYWDYPTSSDTQPGRDLADASGNNANHYDLPYPINSPYYITVAGQFQNSDSPYGTFDQGGNVWEWNEAVIDSTRGRRGGAYDIYGVWLRGWARNSGSPSFESTTSGFRVVEVPEPSAAGLLVIGGLFAAWNRRIPR
ncbi:MAG: SUMF1/EgtB/PvdO family nonheme iron enzyme [Phycisphaerae bacterium]